MSAIDTIRLSARNGRAGIIAQMIEAVMLWNDTRITRKALSRLSERELNDIGLTRFDAENF